MSNIDVDKYYEEEKEKNKILREEYRKIAEFMGYVYIPSNDLRVTEKNYLSGWYRKIGLPSKFADKDNLIIIPKKGGPSYITRKTLELNFRHDWNSLMRVVGRIEKLESQKFGGFHVHIDKDCVLIQAKNRTKESTYSKMYCSNEDKKKAVYESVLLFIEFWVS